LLVFLLLAGEGSSQLAAGASSGDRDTLLALKTVASRARKRQCQALACVAARLLREKDAELDAARPRAADLEERLRQAAAEGQAWRGLACTNEAVAMGLRSALDTIFLRGAGTGAAPVVQQPAEEGFGKSGLALVAEAADDAESCCFVEAEDVGAGAGAATSSSLAANNSKWACRACGGGEASVLVLPCRHLCLCKAC
ncbi:hypothetical protein BAE44_0004566, partial [Dichanthelium oligosanthes]